MCANVCAFFLAFSFWSIILWQCDWCISLCHGNSWLITFNMFRCIVGIFVVVVAYFRFCWLAFDKIYLSIYIIWLDLTSFFCTSGARTFWTSQIDWHNSLQSFIYLLKIETQRERERQGTYRHAFTYSLTQTLALSFVIVPWIYVIVS